MIDSTLVQVILSGVLTGGVYALVAIGLALIWGLMGLINFAHGDLLMLGMYCSFWLWYFFKIDPIFSVPITAALLFIVGVLIYYGITRRVLKAERYSQIFATFGLSIAIRATAQYIWSPNYRMIDKPILEGVIRFGEISLGRAHVVAGVSAFIISIILYLFIRFTDVGRALLATAEDRQTAEVMGIDTNKMFALGWGIGVGCVGIAGGLMTSYFYVFPDVGLMFGTLASAIVALGGFGSIPGTLFAAFLVGIVQTTASYFINPALKLVVVYLLYIAVVVIRPKGLFGRW